jgi:hypothetical protein
MRARNHIFNVGLVTLSAFLLFMAGCGGDDNSTTITGDTGGTEPHPQYDEVQQQLEDFLESSIALVADGMSMTEVGSNDLDKIVFGGQNPDSSTGGDWQVFFLGEASASIWGLDSIQFQKNLQPQPTALGCDRVIFKHQYQVTNVDTNITHTDYEVSSDFDIRNLDGTTASISGTHDLLWQSKYVSQDSTVWWEYDIQTEFTGFTVDKSGSNWSGGCPNTATVTATVDVSYQKDDASAVTSSWQLDLTFTDGLMQVDAAVDNLNLQYSQQICTAN